MNIQVIGSSSSGNAYVISDEQTRIMIDCGLPIKRLQEATGYTLTSLSGCLVSHSHQDHCKAVKDLVRLGVNVYSSVDMFKAIGVTGHRCKPVESEKQFTVGTFNIMPFELVHDVVNYGFLIYSTATSEKLVYITDTMYTPFRFDGVTHWMIEANNSEESLNENVENGSLHPSLKRRIMRSHMSLETVLEIFEANDMSHTEQIYLIHLSDNNSRENEFKDKVEKATGVQVIVC